MNWRDYIIADKDVLLGKPVIKDTRLSVEFLIGLLASGWTEDQILENYPRLTKKHLQAIFQFVQESLKDGLFFELPKKSA